MNRYLLAIGLTTVYLAITGCTGVETKCATTPVVVKQTEVRYVTVDTKLTAPIRDPGPALFPGITVGGALQSAAQRGNALERANQRLACIASVQGRQVQPVAQSTCGTDP